MATAFNADDLNRLLVDSQDQIVASVKEKLIERLSSNYEWQLTDLINKEVKEFFAAEVAPIIKQNLSDTKGEILSAAMTGASQIAVKLGEALTASVAENLSNDWKAKQIFKALFD